MVRIDCELKILNKKKRDLKRADKEEKKENTSMKKSKVYNSSYSSEIKGLPETNVLLLLMKLYGHQYKE
jgi:hypothetical protein